MSNHLLSDRFSIREEDPGLGTGSLVCRQFNIDIDSLNGSVAIGVMSTQQVLVHLPEELVRRFRRAVAPRQRSKFIERLLEEALPTDEVSDDDPLYQAALAVERDEALAAEMAEWESTMLGDGIIAEPGIDPKP